MWPLIAFFTNCFSIQLPLAPVVLCETNGSHYSLTQTSTWLRCWYLQFSFCLFEDPLLAALGFKESNMMVHYGEHANIIILLKYLQTCFSFPYSGMLARQAA